MTTNRPSRLDPAGDRGTDNRVSGPAELLEAIPYLLGFHPARSIVLVGMANRRVVVVARLDLADAVAGTPETVASMKRGGVREIALALFDADADPTRPLEPLPWSDEALRAAEIVGQAGCELIDVLLVAQGRWWSYLCGVPECCPPTGAPMPATPSAYAAAATVAGVAVLPDREAVAATLDPLPDREAVSVQLLAAELAATDQPAGAAGRARAGSPLAVKRALFAAARAANEVGWPGIEEADVVRFAVALRSIELRDAVWLALDAGRLDGRPLWRELARRAPAPYDATPLFLFAWRTWRAGDGTLARIAAERAVASDPGLSAADLLLAALSAGINPRSLPRLHARAEPRRRRRAVPGGRR